MRMKIRKREPVKARSTKQVPLPVAPPRAGVFDVAHIPVYKRSEEAHMEYFRRAEERERARWKQLSPTAEAQVVRLQQRRNVSGWYPWQYNDVIGWVRVHTELGILHFAIAIRPSVRGRRTGQVIGEMDESALKVYGSRAQTSAQIAEEVIETARAIAGVPPLDKFFVDSAGFIALARSVDWREILRGSHRGDLVQ